MKRLRVDYEDGSHSYVNQPNDLEIWLMNAIATTVAFIILCIWYVSYIAREKKFPPKGSIW